MKISYCIFLFIFLACSFNSIAQTASISGRVEGDDGRPLVAASVTILGKQSGTPTNDSGRFNLQVRAGRAIALVFSATGYKPQQRNFYLAPGESETIIVVLELGEGTLPDATVTATRRGRQQVGLVQINPKKALDAPAPIGGIENLIKVFVNSRSELSSQYEVRGGNYDENLVYVNDFEVFRPYLVRSGQQEGLSFINPELARNVNFYNGAFPARYGDKMSSVLDVEYKKPKDFHGSAYVGLLEQGFHLEGSLPQPPSERFSRAGLQRRRANTSNKGTVTYLLGVRNRSLRNLLGSQETKGNYIPHSADLQGQLNWQPNNKWMFELLGNLSNTKFTLEPEESKQTSSVFTPQFSSNLGLDVFFTGREVDLYKTRMIGISATRMINARFRLKGMLSYFRNQEEENINIEGMYLFGDRNFDKSSAEFGLITNPLGAGTYLNYARNKLDVQVINGSVKGTLDNRKHYWQFGSSIEQNIIADKQNEWEWQDSAGYSLPNRPGPLQIYRSVKGQSDIDVTRFSGYIQDNITIDTSRFFLLVQAGLRYNYNTLNNEFLLSPRVGLSFSLKQWKEDIIF
jgi:hypothetical protein